MTDRVCENGCWTSLFRGWSGAVVLATTLLTAGCAESNGSGDSALKANTGVDDPVIDALFAEWNVAGQPGCAVSISQNGVPVFSRGYGYANLDYDIAVTPQTVFDVASVTKQFVAATLSQLEEEGKLSLDDDVRKWLPELPQYEWPVTLRHMVHHTSGLRDYLNLFPLAGRGNEFPISHPQILAMMARQRALVFEPGDRYLYSNSAYMLLAQVVERAGGESLGPAARRRFFEPLGMASSVMYDDLQRIIPLRATGYAVDDNGSVRVVHNYNFDVVGDGQLYTTVEDLLRWDEWLHGSQKPTIHATMLTEGQLNNGERTGYAQGLRLDEYRGLRTVGHSGSSWGFRTELVRFVDPGLAIAVACNSDNAGPLRMARRVADHLLADRLGPVSTEDQLDEAETSPEPAKALQLDAAQLAHFVGAFHSPELDAIYRFGIADGTLELRIEQEPPVEIVAITEDSFEIRFQEQWSWGPEKARVDFERDRAGLVVGFELSSGSERGLLFVRAPLS